MADKQLPAITAASALSGADLLYAMQGANSRKATVAQVLDFIRANFHRGALVTKSANQTTANYSTATAIAFDSEGYDTDTIHDNSTNNSRLTVPSGVTKVRLTGNVYTSSVTANEDIVLDIRKNGVQSVLGLGNNMTRSSIGFARTNVESAVMIVTAGDYFQLFLSTTADTSITVEKDLTWFAMEILG